MISKKSSQKLKQRKLPEMTVTFKVTVICIFLSPYIVGFTSDSTNSYTEISYGGGGGQYVYHDCSGAHKQQFVDAGFLIRKKYEGPYRIGIGIGGWSSDEKGSYLIAVPELALDWNYFSIGTTGIRFGSFDDLYLEGRTFDRPPFFSGSGGLRLGIGKVLKDSDTRVWIGSNVFPYNNTGIATQIDFPMGNKKYLFVNGRYGKDKSSNMDEFGLSVGMRMVTD